MSEPLVLVRDAAAVRTLTLNRPQALNSFNGPVHVALLAALDAAAADPGVRCVVLTGAGRAFCAGQDLADPIVADADGAPDLGVLLERHYLPLVKRLRTMPVPVVAAVNGVAAGAGANVALACDIVVAARSASFLQAFAKIGLLPDAGGTWLLPRLVGRARALGLAMLADRLPAAEAERIGLVWQCFDDTTFTADVAALAARLAAMPAAALVATREAMDHAQQLGLDAALVEEAKRQTVLGRAADFREGVAAFAERRPPRFTDR